MRKLKPYLKALVAVLIDVLYAVQAAMTDGGITEPEWMGIAALTLAAIAVYLTPNKEATVNPNKDYVPDDEPELRSDGTE